MSIRIWHILVVSALALNFSFARNGQCTENKTAATQGCGCALK
jgi:hypothetical protein